MAQHKMYAFQFEEFLQEQKESVSDCAKKLGITPNSLRKMVQRGTIKPSIYRKLCETYGTLPVVASPL